MYSDSVGNQLEIQFKYHINISMKQNPRDFERIPYSIVYFTGTPFIP